MVPHGGGEPCHHRGTLTPLSSVLTAVKRLFSCPGRTIFGCTERSKLHGEQHTGIGEQRPCEVRLACTFLPGPKVHGHLDDRCRLDEEQSEMYSRDGLSQNMVCPKIPMMGA